MVLKKTEIGIKPALTIHRFADIMAEMLMG